tara:strand:- start:1016 stop:1222 length:207 start_codon:yes stop_codon:yes gene_type:complete
MTAVPAVAPEPSQDEYKEIHMHNQKLTDDSQRQRCEVWTRVMGYHRPVSAFNKGKQSEHRERLHFQER